MRIAWAVGRDFVDADTDLPLLQVAASAAGIESSIEVWDDPDVRWAEWDLVVVRSCWDYVPRREQFLAWTRSVPRLANPAETIAWSTDKVYLRQLEDAGVQVVPTTWSVTARSELPEADAWVVKPTISAGSADTARWTDPDQAVTHSRRLVDQGRPTMVQPYVDSIDSAGETGLLYFAGEFSHAFRKGALLVADDDPRSQPELKEDITARQPTAAQVQLGQRVVETVERITGSMPLYARVDLVDAPRQTLQVMEVELAEPSFFLPVAEGAADRFVAAVADHVRALPGRA